MSELAAFKQALDDAGQPWSRLGVRIIGVAIVALLALHIAPPGPYAVYALPVVVAAFAAGWIFLMVAFVKRRAWARRNPVEHVALPEAS